MTRVRAILGDITATEVDAIVNAANNRLVPGGGVDGAINAAGGPSIAAEMAEIAHREGGCPAGEAVITGAGSLPARHVIHTVGPIWGRARDEESVALLASCYRSSLDLAEEYACRTIAFPNISTGVYGFPKPLAAETGVSAVGQWLAENADVIDTVQFVCFDEENYVLYEELLGG